MTPSNMQYISALQETENLKLKENLYEHFFYFLNFQMQEKIGPTENFKGEIFTNAIK